MGCECWNGVEIFGPKAEIDRFTRLYVVPDPHPGEERRSLSVEFDMLGLIANGDLHDANAVAGTEPSGHTWNFRDRASGGGRTYWFAFDTDRGFPVSTFKRLAALFPDVAFDCDCIDSDDDYMGYGWFNTPLGGEDFEQDYEVPADYWTTGGCKRDPIAEIRYQRLLAKLRRAVR